MAVLAKTAADGCVDGDADRTVALVFFVAGLIVAGLRMVVAGMRMVVARMRMVVAVGVLGVAAYGLCVRTSVMAAAVVVLVPERREGHREQRGNDRADD